MLFTISNTRGYGIIDYKLPIKQKDLHYLYKVTNGNVARAREKNVITIVIDDLDQLISLMHDIEHELIIAKPIYAETVGHIEIYDDLRE